MMTHLKITPIYTQGSLSIYRHRRQHFKIGTKYLKFMWINSYYQRIGKN